MAKIKLTNYLNRIEKEYIKARAKWEETQKQIQFENNNFESIKWVNYTPQGRKELRNKHNTNIDRLKNELEKIRQDFTDNVTEIQADSDKLFNRMYQYTPSDIDEKGLAIIQNSNIEPDELITLAESYKAKDNYTMYFLIADKLKTEKGLDNLSESEQKGHDYYIQAKENKTRKDHELLNGFRDVCLKSLRDDVTLSDGIGNIHNDFLVDFTKGTDNIQINDVELWD